MLKVSAIVVTFNRLKLLKKCICGLLKQSYKLNNIIIINNDSTDGTKSYLIHLRNPFIKYKNLSKNIGGSGGFSTGLKFACEHTDSDLFWMMDDDSYPTKDALKNLINGVNDVHKQFGFICSNVRGVNSNAPCNIPKVDKDWTRLLPSQLIKIKQATFVSFMVSRHMVYKVGLPVAEMFIWGDDLEYSLRLHNILPCYFVCDSITLHDDGNTHGHSMFNLPRNKEKFLGYDFRNELYAIRKHCSIKYVIYKVLLDIFCIIRFPFRAHHDKLRKMYYTTRGLIEGMTFNPKIKFPQKFHK